MSNGVNQGRINFITESIDAKFVAGENLEEFDNIISVKSTMIV